MEGFFSRLEVVSAAYLGAIVAYQMPRFFTSNLVLRDLLFRNKFRQDMRQTFLAVFLGFKRVDRDCTPFYLSEIRQ